MMYNLPIFPITSFWLINTPTKKYQQNSLVLLPKKRHNKIKTISPPPECQCRVREQQLT